MIPNRYSSEAIVLARRNYSESDRLVTLFTKDYGRLTVLAKGVRKPSSRKRGSLEVFSKISFAAARGKGFDVMTESQLLSSHSDIRHDIKKVSVAYFVLETVRRLTEDEEPHRDLYIFLSKSLLELEDTNTLRSFRKKFIVDALTLLGFWPLGKPLDDPDSELERIVEREMTTKRVGRSITS